MACTKIKGEHCFETCRMERELRRLIRLVEMRKQQYDQACLACQELLQPRPRNFLVKEESEESTKPTVTALLPLDPKEEAEVKLIDDLLSRAQTARSKVERKYQLVALNRPTQEQASSCLYAQCTVEKVDKLEEASDARPSGSAHKSAPQSRRFPGRTENPAAAKGKQLSHPNKGNPDFKQKRGHMKESNERDSSAAASKIKQLVKNPIPLKHSEVLHPTAGLQKMVSHSASSCSFVKPAHATAPFKTDPNIPVPKRNQLTRSIRVPNPKVKISSQSDKLSLSSAVDSKAGCLHDTVFCENKTLNDKRNCETFDMESEGKGRVLDESVREKTKEKNSYTVTGNIGFSSTNAQQLGATQNTLDSDGAAGNSDDQEQFTLQSDGSSIKIPANLRKEYGRNYELRTKLMERKVNPRAHTAKQNFISKLEKTFNGDDEMVKRHRLWYCHNAFKRLGALLEDLKLDQLTESSPAEEVIRAKCITEFILSSFAELSEEVDSLSKEHFELIDDGSSNDQSFALVEQEDLWSPPLIWLPPELQGEDPLPSPSVLEYSTLSELCQYMGTLFKIQNLKLQIHLSKIAMSELAPLLENMDPQHPDYPAVFRGVHALLTSNSQHLPTFVHSESCSAFS